MRNNENKQTVTEDKKPKSGIKRILHYVQYQVIAIIVIGILYLILNPEPLKDGKKLAKEGKHIDAISEFVTGLDNYYNGNISGSQKTRRLISLSYKVNLHNFYYNMALSYEALAKTAEEEGNTEDTLIYYAYAIEAYDSVLLEKEKHKKSIEAVEIAKAKFTELNGSPYVMGTLFESDEEETVANVELTEDKLKLITDQQIKTAQIFVDKQDYESAITQYDVGLHYAPNSIELNELKLVALYELKNYKEAKKSIKTIIKLDKDNATAKKYKDMIK